MADNLPRPSTAASTPDRSPQPTRRSSHAEQGSSSAADSTVREAETQKRQSRPLRPVKLAGEYRTQTRSLIPTDATTVNQSRRPQDLRRMTSRPTPHRGATFSVDDASQEIEEDVGQNRLTRISSGSMRKPPSTLRRRPTTSMRQALAENDEMEDTEQQAAAGAPTESQIDWKSTAEDTAVPIDEDVANEDDDDVDLNDDSSDAESFTLKDRQEAINETHPFGIRIWKAALYKKNRSVEKGAEGDIHSTPGGQISRWLWIFNGIWTLLFGWWLALIAVVGFLLFRIFSFVPGCVEYGDVLWGLSRYLFYPFGKYVKLISDEAYAEEDEGEGRSISEYEQWQSGDIEEGRLFFGPAKTLSGRRKSSITSERGAETDALLGHNAREGRRLGNDVKTKRRLFGRGQWTFGRVVFFILFYGILAPMLLTVSLICWLGVFSLPMGRVTLILFDHLRRHPLAMEFHSDSTYTRGPGAAPSSILLCTYRAVGIKYWKYTIDGTNIFLINLLGVVAFVIFDYWVLYIGLGLKIALTNNIFVFLLALFSIIPLAYFIGQAVASISAQSTMGVGAVVNAFFSTIVEVFLYCVALRQGKAQLVEGSLIGSIFAGILLLPGISMCFGAIKRKTQRFNVKSAGVTSTMLLFATIGAFGPTLFYQIYGSHELNCHQCKKDLDDSDPLDRDCRRCFFAQIPAVHDPFYVNAVRPYVWFAAIALFLAYAVGLLFTLRTHAATIWNMDVDEKKPEHYMTASQVHNAISNAKPPSTDYGTVNGVNHGALSRQSTAGTLPRSDIRESQLYKRILSQSLKQVGMAPSTEDSDHKKSITIDTLETHTDGSPTIREPPAVDSKRRSSLQVQGLSDEDSQTIVQQMAEMAATAAAVAARDATSAPHKTAVMSRTTSLHASHHHEQHLNITHPTPPPTNADEQVMAGEVAGGGHDAPNWGRVKSYVVLLSATIAYAIIAEILVDTVDSVLANSDIDEKFLGITLFALVPNTTEFLNAISFAMNGNIALSMEIGSAYALQVCLLQIPALVLFSEINSNFIDPSEIISHTFTLIFPQWDMVTVILCVFLLSYMYGEGKSNYFKGSILILSYLVVLVGFYYSGFNTIDVIDPNHPDTDGPHRHRYKTMGSKKPLVIY